MNHAPSQSVLNGNLYHARCTFLPAIRLWERSCLVYANTLDVGSIFETKYGILFRLTRKDERSYTCERLDVPATVTNRVPDFKVRPLASDELNQLNEPKEETP